MSSLPGSVCSKCTKKLTAPCHGEDMKCPYIKTKPRNLRYLWIPILFVFGLLLFGCESDHYEQIEPTVCNDRDTGYVIIFNRWAHLPDDTMPVIRIQGTFYENACEGGTKRKLLPVSPVIKYWKDTSAANKFEHCKEK